MNKTERTLEKIFRFCLKIFYYYYFILSVFNLIFFYFKLYNLVNITTILMLISLFIELIKGYVRGCFGIFGYVISIGLSIYFMKDIWYGLSIGISIMSILNILINKMIGKFLTFMIRKFK